MSFRREHVEHDPTFPFPTRYIEYREPKIVDLDPPPPEGPIRYVYVRVREASILDFQNFHPLEMVNPEFEVVIEYLQQAQRKVWRGIAPIWDGERHEFVRSGYYLVYRTHFWSRESMPTAVPEDAAQRLKDAE